MSNLDDSQIGIEYDPSASSNKIVRYEPLPRGLVYGILVIAVLFAVWLFAWSVWATVTINRLSSESVKSGQYDKHITDDRLHHSRFEEVDEDISTLRERMLKAEHALDLIEKAGKD